MGRDERHLDLNVIGQMRAAVRAGKLELQSHAHSISKPVPAGKPVQRAPSAKWPDPIHVQFVRLRRGDRNYYSKSRLREMARMGAKP